MILPDSTWQQGSWQPLTVPVGTCKQCGTLTTHVRDMNRFGQGVRSERRTHGGNKCKHTHARDVTRDNLAKNSL